MIDIKEDDLDLIKKSLENPNNLKYIIDKYEYQILWYIKKFVKNKEDIEDIFQNVFIKVYRYLNEYNPKYKFSSWLYQITHNEIINYIKKHKDSENNLSIDDDEKNIIFNKLTHEVDYHLDIMNKTKHKIIKEVLSKLKPEYKEVLILYFLQDKKYNEISVILKKPIGTISTMLHRAKLQFKQIAINYNLKKII